MKSRLRAAVVVTIVAGLVLAGIGSVVGKSPKERDQIRAADRVSQRYDAALARHVASAAAAIQKQHEADQDGYPDLLDLVEARIDKAPKISARGTTAYGREHSDGFAGAKAARSIALKPLNDLKAYLRADAIPVSRFIAAGKKLVKLRPGTLLGDAPVMSGAPLRELVLPPFEKARKAIKKQKAPKGSELLLLDLTTYANDAVAMTKDGAKKLDNADPFFFRLGDRPVELFQRLAALEKAIQIQVAKRVEIVGAP